MKQLFSLLLLSFCCLAAAHAQTKTQKNVLFIMADDFNHWIGEIGYYPQVKTPNLDKLARAGVLFTDAHCSSPVCNPSRNALLSGYRPSTTGISSNQGGYVRSVTGFQNIVTLHQYFKNQGYFSYGGGKIWHPGKMGATDTDPNNWSAQYKDGTGSPGGSFYRFESTTASEFVWSAGVFDINTSNDTRMANHFAEQLKNYNQSANKDKPFFMACGFFRPHLPWNVHKQFFDMFGIDTLDIPKGYKQYDLSDIPQSSAASIHTELVAKNKWKEGIRAYLANLAYADYNVGIVLDALENSPHKNNTIVVFVGDHGWHLGEKDRWSKYAVYDQAHHTTLVIYDPSAKGNGQKCTKVVSMQDLYPTLVDIAGLDPKTDIEGNSLATLLDTPNNPAWNKPIMMTYSGINMIKTNEYRFVDDGTKSQLYRIDTDPHEWTNLINNQQHAAALATLRKQMDTIVKVGTELRTKLLSNYKFVPTQNKIPGKIETENYDEGANNHTYKDSDLINNGNVYRKDGVDLAITSDPSGGGYDVNNTAAKEWLQYTLSQFTPGSYDISLRVLPGGNTEQALKLFIDEQEIGTIAIPTGSAWQTVQLKNVNLNMEKAYRLRVEVLGGGFAVNHIEFVKSEIVGVFNLKNDGREPFIKDTIVRENELWLDLTYTDPMVKLTVFSPSGQLIQQNNIVGEREVRYKLEKTLPTGIYLMQLQDEQQERTEKFIVK